MAATNEVQITPPPNGPVTIAEHANRLAEGLERVLNDWPYCAPEVIEGERPVVERFVREFRLAQEATDAG